jgi:phosphoglycerol transferase MdoB-like AlkP superfamily enzyme
MDFDFYFFWYNLPDALPAMWKLFAPWFLIIALSISAFMFLQNAAFSPGRNAFGKSVRKVGFFLAAIMILSSLCQFATIETIRGSTAGFLYTSFFSDRSLRNNYRELYKKHIAGMQANSQKSTGTVDPSLMGDVIFFIKQESLNGLLVGSKITPQLLRAGRDGILFDKQYGNSIQSIRGYACILCGAPPSITEALADLYPASELKKLSCLPQIFKALGYHTYYFFGGSRNPRIKHFAESIGFEKVLSDEIVQPGDFKFDWGYREDVYFTRVHEYLQKRHTKDKLFIFIDTGATNHDPFEVLDDKLLDKIPFPQAKKFEEHLANTTFVQDAYFGKFYDLFQKYYGFNGSLFAVSDHSWPIPVHTLNMYNERGAYEENFLISMLFVPPETKKNAFAAGSIVTQRFSQMDIAPTIFDLIGLKQNYMLGESFAPWLLASQNSNKSAPEKIKVSIQPYGGGFISAIQYPKKYLFDVLNRKVQVFDLEKDPTEQSPAIHDADKYKHLIKEFFHPGCSDLQ